MFPCSVCLDYVCNMHDMLLPVYPNNLFSISLSLSHSLKFRQPVSQSLISQSPSSSIIQSLSIYITHDIWSSICKTKLWKEGNILVWFFFSLKLFVKFLFVCREKTCLQSRVFLISVTGFMTRFSLLHLVKVCWTTWRC